MKEAITYGDIRRELNFLNEALSPVTEAMMTPDKRIEAIRDIVKNHQAQKVDGTLVDAFTAQAIIQVYDKVNDANKMKLASMPASKLAAVVWKLVK